jgi:hypothetical protein
MKIATSVPRAKAAVRPRDTRCAPPATSRVAHRPISLSCCTPRQKAAPAGRLHWSAPSFPFFAEPIEIGDGVWLTAFQRVLGGARIPPHHAVVGSAERGR